MPVRIPSCDPIAKRPSLVQTPPKQVPVEQAVPLGLGAGAAQVPVDGVQVP